MTKAFFLSLGDLFDGRVLGIVLRALLVTLLVFVVIGVTLGWALNGSDPCAWFDDYGGCMLGGWASGLSALFLTFVAIWFLFPAIAFGVMWAYADRIIAAVEARHYPEVALAACAQGMGGLALLGLRSALRLMLFNLIALPFYILLLITGIGTVVLFVAVNGILFGRDLGEMIAWRHHEGPARVQWLKETRRSRMAIGMGVAALVLVPFVNLIAPAFGAILVTHLFHRDGGREIRYASPRT